MSFAGYLVKIGNKEFPTEQIAESSYYATPSQRQDLDSYRDNIGILHRDVVDHKPSKVEFKTMDGLTDAEITTIWNIFESECSNETELKAAVEFYDPLTGVYVTEDMYLKMPKIQIDYIDRDANVIYHKAVQFVLTGY
ncbi:MAG: hypothetical protein E7290_12550 [Lachnospiraceae bacterium]|nr:hypothetical protein [Lachnospiraceae bacterium]